MAKDAKIVKTSEGKFSVTARVFGNSNVLMKAADSVQSNIIDPFQKDYSPDHIIAPPYSPLTLMKIGEASDSLGALVRTMVTNIDGFGWELTKPEWTKGKDEDAEAISEKARINILFNYINSDVDLNTLRQDIRADIEWCGNGYMEVVRNRGGDIAEMYRAPAFQTRLCMQDKEWTQYEEKVRDDNGKFQVITRRKRFRRYVQIDSWNHKVYFKEFGDPRVLSSLTGQVVKSSGAPATEIIHFKRHCPYSVYGMPLWLGNMMAIVGSHKAEEINYLYFENKTIPPMVVTVSGGSLTDDTVKKLTEVFDRQIKGVQNFHSALILEATPHDVGASTGNVMPGERLSPVKIDIKPLTQYMQKDAMFTEYRKTNQENLEAAFRLAPIYTGRSKDYTRATAMEAARVMEEQVFHPERRAYDYIINRRVLSDLKINHWTFQSLGAKTSDDVAIVTAMSSVKEALTVGMVLRAVAAMQNVPVEEIDPELDKMLIGKLLYPGLGDVSGNIIGGDRGANQDDDNDDIEDNSGKVTKLLKTISIIREKLSDEELKHKLIRVA